MKRISSGFHDKITVRKGSYGSISPSLIDQRYPWIFNPEKIGVH